MRTMDARAVLTLLAGCCLMLTVSGVSGKTFRRRATETSDRSGCVKTIISNNGDRTKFSFELNYPAAKVTHCQVEAGERESWTIEPLSSDDAVQELNITGDRLLTTDGKVSTNTNAEWQEKVDQLVETITRRITKRIEEIMPLVAKMVTGYQKIGNLSSLYKMHPVGMTWILAKNMCETEGAHLLIINNVEEQDVVPKLFNKSPRFQGDDWDESAFIGVHRSEGDFWTVLGQRLSTIGYSPWSPRFPGLNSHLNCVLVTSMGLMFVHACNGKDAFICEMPMDLI